MMHRNVNNCIRCTLIKRGVTEAFITEAHLTSCVMRVDMTTKEESVTGSDHDTDELNSYDKTLAISVALSSIDARSAYVKAESLENRMERDITGTKPQMPKEKRHKCLAQQWRIEGERSVTCGKALNNTKPQKVLKNVLQTLFY